MADSADGDGDVFATEMSAVEAKMSVKVRSRDLETLALAPRS